MNDKNILDIKQLIKPINNKNPCGENLRTKQQYISLYYEIKDTRTYARQIERQIMQGEKLTSPAKEWNTVYKIAIKILTSISKDLEICAWLIEALIREFQFTGLKQGFHLLYCLIEHYWDNLYPLDDEDGIINKISPLISLNGENANGTLIFPISNVLITEGQSYGPFTFWQYEQAIAMEKIMDPTIHKKRLKEGTTTLSQIKLAAKETSLLFYQNLHHELTETINEFTALTKLLNDKCGSMATPSSQIKNILTAFHNALLNLAKDKISENNNAPHQTPSLTDNTRAINVDKTDILSRNDALQIVLSVANYFKKTEPHSPLPYILEHAVFLGNLSFPELLTEIVQSEEVKNHIFRLTGIK